MVGWKTIRACPSNRCRGSLQSPRRALTMQCTCDTCGTMYLVCLAFGKPEPWEHASHFLQIIAEEAVHLPTGRVFGGVGERRNESPRIAQIPAPKGHDDGFLQDIVGQLEGKGDKCKRK